MKIELMDAEKFTRDNTEGFACAELELLNKALRRGLAHELSGRQVSDDMRGQLVKWLSDKINNNWRDGRNTVTSLLR